ncbi:uncharacterized protein BO66DRAFT_438411 [Aspergillus aculeatinus CBS 121060]|uniref:Uncharacterized protein n=1 Tax=Aspergillus aculeatinus CBS 121060 TaxID=1448322 RepID=A0ACD1HA04_9EURO|nr:hypothetical protein BO66DRAFT_438411 [Aspergillus aculeatinus CBS 121060]RAH70412.1 hypothetical protein BO66DRAFT_438411 [Aspergillus aculeatinus CBS 121060]
MAATTGNMNYICVIYAFIGCIIVADWFARARKLNPNLETELETEWDEPGTGGQMVFNHNSHKLICHWSLFKHARYFANRQTKVIEDDKAVEVVLRLEETISMPSEETKNLPGLGRSFSVTKIRARRPTNASQQPSVSIRASVVGVDGNWV